MSFVIAAGRREIAGSENDERSRREDALMRLRAPGRAQAPAWCVRSRVALAQALGTFAARSLAPTGTAASNLFLSGNDSVDADVHGQTNDKDDTHHDGGISGLSGHVVANSFLRTDTGARHENFFRARASMQRGERNFQGQHDAQAGVRRGDGRPLRRQLRRQHRLPPVHAFPILQVDSKFSAPDPTNILLVGDFDGDKQDDVFMATGAGWLYSPGANAEWRFLSAKTETEQRLFLGFAA